MNCERCGQEVEDALCSDCIFETEEDNSWKDELIGELANACELALFAITHDHSNPEDVSVVENVIAKVEKLKTQGYLLILDKSESDAHKSSK